MVQEQKLVTHNHPHTRTHTHTHTHIHTQTLLPASCSSLIWLFNCGAFTCQGLIDNTAAGFICLMKKKKLHIYCKYCIFIFFFCRTKICNHLILLVEFFKGAFLTSHQSLFFNYYFGTISLWSTCLSNTAASKWWRVNTTLRSSVEHLLWLC